MADSVLSLGTATGGGSIAVDSLGGTLYPYGKLVHGGAGTATPVTAVNPLPVNGTVTPAGGAVTPSDSLANPTTHGAVVSHGLHYDGKAGTWARHPPRIEGYAESEVLASAARTATASSPTLSSRGARGVAVLLRLTTKPASGGDLTLQIRPKIGEFDSNQGSLQRTIAHATVADGGAYSLLVYPGITPSDYTALTGPQLVALNAVITPSFLVSVSHSDSESWTYAVAATLLP